MTSSVFAELWRAAEPDMDATMGEDFQWIPRAAPLTSNGAPDVNARSVVDPDRTAEYFTGRFFEQARQTPPHGRNKPLSDAHTLSGTQPRLSLSSVEAARLLGAVTSFAVGDWVWRRCGDQIYRIEDIQKDDLGMHEFPLTRIGSSQG